MTGRSLLLDQIHEVDDAARADIGAVAAADALVIVDRGHEVLDLDGFRRALALALHAADAADVADLARDGALVLIAAADEHSLLIRHLLNDLLRAGLGAGAAADALVVVDLNNAIVVLMYSRYRTSLLARHRKV